MQFVKTSILKSRDGIILEESKGKEEAVETGLNYFSNKDQFVSEQTASLKAKNHEGALAATPQLKFNAPPTVSQTNDPDEEGFNVRAESSDCILAVKVQKYCVGPPCREHM
eukprot:Filipodium_phascolosomae@DN2317_c0_g1_i3.p1